jgi:hypothetical protein
MCPAPLQWSAYWNESAAYRVQKSPQDVLKTRLLRRSLQSHMPQQKYVIVIKVMRRKYAAIFCDAIFPINFDDRNDGNGLIYFSISWQHPGTVNTALPRLREWTLGRSSRAPSGQQLTR